MTTQFSPLSREAQEWLALRAPDLVRTDGGAAVNPYDEAHRLERRVDFLAIPSIDPRERRDSKVASALIAGVHPTTGRRLTRGPPRESQLDVGGEAREEAMQRRERGGGAAALLARAARRRQDHAAQRAPHHRPSGGAQSYPTAAPPDAHTDAEDHPSDEPWAHPEQDDEAREREEAARDAEAQVQQRTEALVWVAAFVLGCIAIILAMKAIWAAGRGRYRR